MSQHAANIGDQRLIPLTQSGNRQSREFGRCPKIDVHDLIETLGRGFRKRTNGPDTRIIDQNVDRPEFRYRFSHQPLTQLRVGNIARDYPYRASSRSGQLTG